ncbi:MAG: hypothetical protein Salg2KO_09680 [Salibacteraceae bacterium]
MSQTAPKHTIYLLSGQGSDERIFQELQWDSTRYSVEYVPFLVPERGESMHHYAGRMARTIATDRPFSLVGVSLGGMVCSELCDSLSPVHTVIISSAKERSELPHRYRFQRFIPIYAILPRSAVKMGAQIAQPLVEPDRKSHKAVFKSMLKDKDKTFMKRSIRMIVNWQKTGYAASIVHIHGDNDHTLPIKRLKPNYVIDSGSHMMTLTRSAEIQLVLNKVFGEFD